MKEPAMYKTAQGWFYRHPKTKIVYGPFRTRKWCRDWVKEYRSEIDEGMANQVAQSA